MKIFNIMQGTNLGGTEKASLLQMIDLKQRGHDCEVLSLNKVGTLRPLLETSGIPATGIEYRGRGGWRSHLRVWKEIRSFDVDVLLMTGHHLLTSTIIGSSGASRKVLCIHFHHAGVKPKWQWRLIYRLACKQFNVITFPSDFVRNEAESICPPVSKIAQTVRNPIVIPDSLTDSDRLAARSSLQLPSDAKIIGNAGGLIPRKRFDIFLQIAKKVYAADSRAFFVIAGDGVERDHLKRLATDLGIAERVRWLGWMPDMAPFYGALDVLLFNSDWDALGMTPLEAMAYGVPVVASVRHGGLAEIITHAEFGFLINEHNIPALAEATLLRLNDPVSAGLAGRKRVASLCDYDRCISQFEQLLVPQPNSGEGQ